jgi:hypothetical protein
MSQLFKRVFALASVTALTGLVSSIAASGCSSTTSVNGDDDASADATTVDVRKASEAGEEEAGPVTCPSTEPLDATSDPWSPPGVSPGACTEKDITDLVAFVDANTTAAYALLKAQVKSASCAACLFVKDGPTWGAFVEKADGSFKRHNFGGCVAVTSGKESCGKAYSQFEDCVGFACQDCTSSAMRTACQTAAAAGACKAAGDAFLEQCGSTAPRDACDKLARTYIFEAAARALCVGLADGGADADAGDDGGDGGDGG